MFTGDIESLRRDLVDPARPMKSSAFASEEPAPFTPVSLKGSLFLVLLVMLPRDVYLRLLETREGNRHQPELSYRDRENLVEFMASKKILVTDRKRRKRKRWKTSLLASGGELALSEKNGKSHMAKCMVDFVRMWMAGLT